MRKRKEAEERQKVLQKLFLRSKSKRVAPGRASSGRALEAAPQGGVAETKTTARSFERKQKRARRGCAGSEERKEIESLPAFDLEKKMKALSENPEKALIFFLLCFLSFNLSLIPASLPRFSRVQTTSQFTLPELPLSFASTPGEYLAKDRAAGALHLRLFSLFVLVGEAGFARF